MGFNQSQQEAIEHNTGPMLVLAGPGSGKTLVITNRIRALIEQQGVNPSNILVITFTKAAATEMRQRFSKLMNQSYLPVNFGTFHAVFFHILKFAYGYKAENIVREEDRQHFFRETVQKMDLEIEDEADFIQGIIGEISKIKNDQINLDNYYSTNCPEDVFRKIYKEYDGFLRRRSQLDFDDMLVYCYELFREREDILRAWQKKYQYILIDEFQDINRIQYEIIKMLALPENNLFIVGDDDQSIYRFRGAEPGIMLNFDKDYPNARRVLLNLNYRCSGEVVKGAVRVISHNRERFEKSIEAFNEDGAPIDVRKFQEFSEQNAYVLRLIQDYVREGVEYKDLAVLFRTNTQPRLLVQKLMEYNIPFKMKDSMPNIYEHWIVKNICSYIKIALGSRKRSEFLQIMNKPKRYLSREAFAGEAVNLEAVKQYYSSRDWMVERIEKLEYDLQMLSTMPPYAAIQYIRKGIGYEEYLQEYAGYRRMKVEELYEVLEEVQEAAKPFQTYEEWFRHMEEYGRELLEQANKRKDLIQAVTLSTMHASKGLEYRIVIMIDANEGITPHHKSVLDEDLEEERRMFYVAMTRAKEKLHIFYSMNRYNKQLQPSRFVGELLVDSAGLKEGELVVHKHYGKCRIIRMDGNKMEIECLANRRRYVLNVEYCVAEQLIDI
ncbi:MAG: ATP-dependent helicase [Lachnospiraceae bacterium]|nr:ATP-dependent helicase [Lachnospiraceae bacterium]